MVPDKAKRLWFRLFPQEPQGELYTRPAQKQDNCHQSNNVTPLSNPGTFYSAISNLGIEIQDGNPGAVGIRAHYTQHCFLAQMDFHVGSGLAGIHDGGNVAQDVFFCGGQYGIWTFWIRFHKASRRRVVATRNATGSDVPSYHAARNTTGYCYTF
jgi:hypothetical protein